MMKTQRDSVLVTASDGTTTPNLQVVRADEAPTKRLFELKELKAQGAELPVGLVVDGKRVRTFRLRPFRLKQEKAISKLKADSKAATIGKFVCGVLSLMVQTVGPHNFDNMNDGHRQLIISQLTMADVLYLWVYLRYEALAQEPVTMNIPCPSCRNEYKWYGDLGTMDVRVVNNDVVSTTREFKLRDGVELGGAARSILKLDMIKWDSLMRRDVVDKQSQEAAIIAGSIVGIEGIERTPFFMLENELDEMTKWDIEGLTREISDNTCGPQMDIQPECPACKYKGVMMLDWGYDSFFARSVLPMTMTS